MSSPLHRFATFTACAAFILLFAGGLVTSTGSALAVPDWPLAFGQYFPRMAGGVLFEHGHRMIAGVVAILTLVLAGWVMATEPRRWMRWTAAAAGGGILLQALLGGITVLYRLPLPVSASHACLGQTVFCLLLLIAQGTSPWFLAAEPQGLGRLWIAGALAFAALYVQLILGAVYRHGGNTLGLHAAWAIVAAVAVGASSAKGLSQAAGNALSRLSTGMIFLLFVQLALGVAALVLRMSALPRMNVWRVAVPTTHVVIGAALLGSAAVWTMRAYALK